MSESEKVFIPKESIDKLISGLKSIRITTREKATRKEVDKLLDLLQEDLNQKNIPLKEQILEKMKESKGVDPNLNANLYILYRNLDSGRITEEQAFELFQMYVRIDPYNKTIV